MPVLELPEVTIHYRDAGEGPAVTLLHGFTQTGESWREVVELMPAEHRWLMPDLRGHGGTVAATGAPHTTAACRLDLERLWDHLGVGASHLVGYSMGGRLALQMAIHLPHRLLSLVTLGAGIGLEGAFRDERLAADARLAAEIEEQGVAPFIDRWLAMPLFAGLARRGPEFMEATRRERLAASAHGLAASLREMGAGATEPVRAHELARLGCRALFAAGGQDVRYLEQARWLAAHVPGAAWTAVPGAGHAAHLEDPGGFARLLADHLSNR